MTTGFAGRKHAHEKPIGAVLVDHHHAAFERFGVSEDDDGCGAGRRGKADRD
ncbi:MAG TPA: hypothetical protein VFZ51_10945 [Woeseiaceae bacterium]